MKMSTFFVRRVYIVVVVVVVPEELPVPREEVESWLVLRNLGGDV